MKTDNPAHTKRIGSSVVGFCPDQWSYVRDSVMVAATFLKYTQNPDLREALIATGEDSILVEANPRDSYWGVGLSKDDDRIFDQTKWRGENKLGTILMEIRNFYTNGKPHAGNS